MIFPTTRLYVEFPEQFGNFDYYMYRFGYHLIENTYSREGNIIPHYEALNMIMSWLFEEMGVIEVSFEKKGKYYLATVVTNEGNYTMDGESLFIGECRTKGIESIPCVLLLAGCLSGKKDTPVDTPEDNIPKPPEDRNTLRPKEVTWNLP